MNTKNKMASMLVSSLGVVMTSLAHAKLGVQSHLGIAEGLLEKAALRGDTAVPVLDAMTHLLSAMKLREEAMEAYEQTEFFKLAAEANMKIHEFIGEGIDVADAVELGFLAVLEPEEKIDAGEAFEQAEGGATVDTSTADA